MKKNEYKYNEVKYDPSKIVDLKQKIVMYERTRKGGDPNYVLPTDSNADNLPKCGEEDVWHFGYVSIDDLIVCSTSQRARDDVMRDKVLRSMENGNFSWAKLTPLNATKFFDAKENKYKYIVHEGQGRLLFFLHHPSVKKLPVLYRISNNYQSSVDCFVENHNPKNTTRIERADDFRIRYEQKQYDAMLIENAIKRGQMKLSFKEYKKNDNDDMVFTRADIGEMMFRMELDQDSKMPKESEVTRMCRILPKYGAVRSIMNLGRRFSKWNNVFTLIYNSVEALKRELHNASEISFDNLISEDFSKRIRMGEKKRKEIMGVTRADKSSDKAVVWLDTLYRKGFIGNEWKVDSGNGKTYYDELVGKIKSNKK